LTNCEGGYRKVLSPLARYGVMGPHTPSIPKIVMREYNNAKMEKPKSFKPMSMIHAQ
jgi:hypothetical protein